jgi:hypothetical protein
VPNSVHRVCQPGKPRFQLRQGEEGISLFDAEQVTVAEVLPTFRAGSLVTTVEVATIESFGLKVMATPGDPDLPDLLRDNHLDILPGDGMTRNQFKAALKALEQSLGGSP